VCSTKYNEKEDEATISQNTRGGRSIGKGRGFGHSKYVITCYNCGVEGHKESKCRNRKNETRINEARMQVTKKDDTTDTSGNVEVLQQEQGENLMLRKLLLKPETKEVEEPEQIKRVFKTKYKIHDK
jgi:hypothetical protein